MWPIVDRSGIALSLVYVKSPGIPERNETGSLAFSAIGGNMNQARLKRRAVLRTLIDELSVLKDEDTRTICIVFTT